LATLLEILKKVSFFQGIRCPYELFVSLYHIALPFEGYVLDEKRHTGPNEYGAVIAQMDFDGGADSFNIDVALFDLAAKTLNNRQAVLLVFELLKGLDIYLSGTAGSQYHEGRGTVISGSLLNRLSNPFYYHPIEVCVGGQKGSYTILPIVKPFYAQWIAESDALPRDEGYFSPTLAACCLNHHRLLHEGRAGNQEVTFPVNGANPQTYSSFLHSFYPSGESPNKLTIALAPYDRGFVPELMAYEETDRNTVTFRYVHIRKPSRPIVKRKIEDVLTAARDRGVDVLVFPELTVDHDALTAIIDFLAHHNTAEQLKLVVAGSFHKERSEGGYVNLSTMLDWQGNVVWQHHKLQRYKMLSEEIAKNPRAQAIRKRFKASAGNHIEENIRTSYPLAFVDTPIGRMATLICLDYLLENVTEAIGRVGCHYLWVPLMTTSIGMFKSHAKDLYGAKHCVLSVCSASVSCCEMIQCKDSNLSFLYAPSRKFGKPEGPVGIVRDENIPLIIYRLDIML
jgi:hypothetical protein